MTDATQAKNTDREIWRGTDEGNGSYYADSIHVTQGDGIGINVGGHVIVMPAFEWHALATGATRVVNDVAATAPGCRIVCEPCGFHCAHEPCGAVSVPQGGADGVREALAEALANFDGNTLSSERMLNHDRRIYRRRAGILAALATSAPPQTAGAPADAMVAQVEERFPNWRSYRDLVDCIDCTLPQLRTEARK